MASKNYLVADQVAFGLFNAIGLSMCKTIKYWLLASVLIFGICPKIWAFTASTIDVPLIHFRDRSDTLRLSYGWLTENIVSRETIVLIHGGPGLSSEGMITSTLVKGLSETNKYNILYFDQRGAGQSTASINDLAPQIFQAQQIVEDIEFLRNHVIRQEKVMVSDLTTLTAGDSL